MSVEGYDDRGFHYGPTSPEGRARAADLSIERRESARVPHDHELVHPGRTVTVKVAGETADAYVTGVVVSWPRHGEPDDLQVLVNIPRELVEYVEVDL